MSSCLICQKSVQPFISFGRMPIANGFLLPENFNAEYFFDLGVAFCPHCFMVQLSELVDPTKLFHDNYAYFSSISVRMAQHFQEFSRMVRQRYLSAPDPLVVEIGSNDGIMLQNFMQAGIRHVGVEPSANVAQAAMAKGVHTVCRFFDEPAGEALRGEYGAADAILGANVICHIPNLDLLIAGVKKLLKEEGVFIFEEPYMGDIVEKTSYDQFYDEHVFYFSLNSLANLFARHGMEIIDVMPQQVHGGSMRYVIARRGVRPIAPVVPETLAKEESLGLKDPGTYARLAQRIGRSREQLVGLLTELRQQGHRIVGYGATSKSTTVTNFCRIGPELIDYISDTTPGKQGKFSPGAHIPVLPYDRFKENYPDYALMFAWNHGEEIMAKEQQFKAAGGKWIVYVPQVGVIE